MKKFLCGVLVGVFGFIITSSVMAGIIFIMENKLLNEPTTMNEAFVFSLGSQFLIWLVLIPLSGVVALRYRLRDSIYLNIGFIVICGTLLGSYLGAVVY